MPNAPDANRLKLISRSLPMAEAGFFDALFTGAFQKLHGLKVAEAGLSTGYRLESSGRYFSLNSAGMQ